MSLSTWESGFFALIVISVVALSLLPPLSNHSKTINFIMLAVAMVELSCRELFARCAAVPAEEAAWSEFFRRYLRDITCGIYRVIGSTCKDRNAHLFQDILQRVYLRLLENERRALRSFRGHTEPEARIFLRTVSNSVALNYIRGEPRWASLDTPISPDIEGGSPRSEMIPDPSGVTEKFILLQDDVERYLDNVLHGSKKHRSMLLFKLVLYDGLSAEELANIPGFRMDSAHAVEQLISRVRKKLRNYLDKH